MPNLSNDIALYLEAFRNGKEKGFNFFFRRHYPALCLFASRITGNQQIAEDIVQEAFLKLWERHSRFAHPAAIKSFLFVTVRNASLDYLHQQQKERAGNAALACLAEPSEKTIEHHLAATEVYTEIYAAINTLPPQCRRIFRMHYIEGKDFRQIAAELHLSLSTIYNQKNRGLTLLRQRVALSAWLIVAAGWMAC